MTRRSNMGCSNGGSCAGVEVIATAAVGVGSGLVARANSVELARLAGWTMGAAVEVRR